MVPFVLVNTGVVMVILVLDALPPKMYLASALNAFKPALAGLTPRLLLLLLPLLLVPLMLLLLLLLLGRFSRLSKSVCATKKGLYCRTWNLAVRLQAESHRGQSHLMSNQMPMPDMQAHTSCHTTLQNSTAHVDI
jgi:hypothetical protein